MFKDDERLRNLKSSLKIERWAGGRAMMTERKSLGKSVDLKDSNKIDLGKKREIKIGETRDTEVEDTNGFLSGDVLVGGNAGKLIRLQR